MQIILHIGAHKTASTHLQLAIGRARAALSRLNVRYVGPDELRRHGLALPEYLSAEAEDQHHGARIRVALGEPCDRLLLSDENMLGNAHNLELIRTAQFYDRAPARLARLAALLPPGQVVLALGIRNPAGFLTSAYDQRLMSGRLESFSDYTQGLDPARLRWSGLIERVTAALPEVAFHVWRLEDYPKNAPLVLQTLLGDAARVVRPGPGIAHPGLSARAHAILMRDAPALAAQGGDAIRARVRALRVDYPKNAQNPGLQPHDPSTLERAAAAYADDCARIETLPGVRALWL